MPGAFEPFTDMDVEDGYIPEELFEEFLARMPQVCVELIVETDDGILLAKRENYPEVWFWPGGRVYKGELLREAAHRIATEELGLSVRIIDRYGPYEHFWEQGNTPGSPTRHTVNIVFHVTPELDTYEISLDDQHAAHRFITENDPGFHEYVQLYLEDNNLV